MTLLAESGQGSAPQAPQVHQAPQASQAPTQAEVRRDIFHVKNRIRCIITDRDRDVRRVYDEHWRSLHPMTAELQRLRWRAAHAKDIIKDLEEQIIEKKLELKACINGSQIKKMLQLIRRVNGLKDPERKHNKHDKIGKMLSKLTNERVTTLRFIIAGYQNEISSLTSLLRSDCKKFNKRESELLKGIGASCRYFERFLQHKTRSDELLDECYARLEELRKLENASSGEKKIQKLGDKTDQLLKLMLTMPPELIKIALANMKKS